MLDDVVEREHREPVVLGEGVDDPGGGPAGGDHLPARHAARPVEQQHDVAGRAPLLHLGRQDGERERALLALGVGGEREGGRGGVPEPQDEVAVEPLTGADREGVALAVDVVEAALDLGDLQPRRVDRRAQAEPHAAGEARQQRRRGDPGGVRDGVGVGLGARPHGRAVDRAARDVARGHDQREPELGRAPSS